CAAAIPKINAQRTAAASFVFMFALSQKHEILKFIGSRSRQARTAICRTARLENHDEPDCSRLVDGSATFKPRSRRASVAPAGAKSAALARYDTSFARVHGHCGADDVRRGRGNRGRRFSAILVPQQVAADLSSSGNESAVKRSGSPKSGSARRTHKNQPPVRPLRASRLFPSKSPLQQDRARAYNSH